MHQTRLVTNQVDAKSCWDAVARILVAAVVGLISLIIGGLARSGTGGGRAGAIGALVLGLSA